MKRTARFLAIAIIATSTMILRDPTPVSACSCVRLERVLADPNLEAAFVGTVTDAPDVEHIQSTADEVTWTFKVDEVYRGELPATIKVKAAASGVSCGFERISVGSRLGVVLRRDNETWHAGLCSSGSPAVLGASSAPIPAAAVMKKNDDRSQWAYAVLLGSGLMLAGAFFVVRRRRSRPQPSRPSAGHRVANECPNRGRNRRRTAHFKKLL